MLPAYIQDFLNKCNFPALTTASEWHKLPNDASLREYYRYKISSDSFIIADCVKEPMSLQKFIKCQHIFANLNIRVPRIYCEDQSIGLALLEDFGDKILNRHITEDNKHSYYKALLDIITHLQQQDLTAVKLPSYNEELLNRELNQFIEHYLQYVLPSAVFAVAVKELQDVFNVLYAQLNHCGKVIVHRDFHLDNMMLLEGDIIGVIDFQDAVLGSPAYDITSLLHDARRFVSEDFEREMLEYFLSHNSYKHDDFMREYHILSLQKNMKIIGIFHRIYRTQHRIEYYKRCDIVWEYIKRVLPFVPIVQDWFTKYDIKFVNSAK